MNNKALAIALTVLMTAWAGRADADIIPMGTIDLTGEGFGAILNILTLQATGRGDGIETGSVSWNGTSDVESGDASNTSQTRTIAELMAAGIANAYEFGILYNVNQQGNLGGLDTDINNFSVQVYSPAGGTALASFSYIGDGTCTPPKSTTNDPDCFPPISNGTGGSGYLFGFDMAQATALQAFFANPLNRVGMSGSISLANDGAENFYATEIQGNEPEPTPVPEPTSMFLLGSGLFGLAAKYRARGKK